MELHEAGFLKLRAQGGELRFSQRSEWMPENLRASIADVLNYALNPDLTPSSTNGINRLDFFHGHFVCNGTDSRIQEVGDAFNRESVAVFKNAGFNQVDNPTKENFAAFARAVDQVDAMSGELLRQLMPLCQTTTVMFHTFEYVTEKIGMKVEDARRHLYVPLGGGPIERIQQRPPVDVLQSLSESLQIDFDAPRIYSHMSHFGFLIDQKGVIHLTQGSGFQLHRFTGHRD